MVGAGLFPRTISFFATSAKVSCRMDHNCVITSKKTLLKLGPKAGCKMVKYAMPNQRSDLGEHNGFSVKKWSEKYPELSRTY